LKQPPPQQQQQQQQQQQHPSDDAVTMAKQNIPIHPFIPPKKNASQTHHPWTTSQNATPAVRMASDPTPCTASEPSAPPKQCDNCGFGCGPQSTSCTCKNQR